MAKLEAKIQWHLFPDMVYKHRTRFTLFAHNKISCEFSTYNNFSTENSRQTSGITIPKALKKRKHLRPLAS